MSRTTTAIWVIFMGVGGVMICGVSDMLFLLSWRRAADAVGAGVDGVSAGQGADLERVAALLARGQVLQLAAGPGVHPAGVPVRAGLHRDHVRSGAELAPGDVVAQRGAAVPLIYPQPGAAVDHRGSDHAVGLWHHVVLVAFLDEVRTGGGQFPVAGIAGV